MEAQPPNREIVVPGEVLDGGGLKPGPGTYREGDRIYASLLGVRFERSGYVTVVPLNGVYIPKPDDLVVGKVEDLGPSHWLVDIRAPYPAPLRATETPWTVEFGDTDRYLRVGDVLLVRVLSVDETKHVQLTIRDRDTGRIRKGHVIEISPVKVARVIGKQGSMIGMLKDRTGCEIFVAQNGRILVDGPVDRTMRLIRAIRSIEDYAQTRGLTDRIRAQLDEEERET